MKTFLFFSAIAIFFISVNSQINFGAVCAAIDENEEVMYEVRDIKQKIILGEVDVLEKRIKKLEPYLGNFEDWSDGSRHRPTFIASNIKSLRPGALDDYWYAEKMVTRAESFFDDAPLPVLDSSSVLGANQYDRELQSENRARFKDHCVKEAKNDPCRNKRETVVNLFKVLDDCKTLQQVDTVMSQHRDKLKLVVAH